MHNDSDIFLSLTQGIFEIIVAIVFFVMANNIGRILRLLRRLEERDKNTKTTI